MVADVRAGSVRLQKGEGLLLLGRIAKTVRDLDLHVVRGGLHPVLAYTVRDSAGEPVRVLRSGGVYQSATYVGRRRMEPVFEYYRAFGRVLEEATARVGAAPRVLVIGGGGCSFPKLASTIAPAARMDVVEIDPAVIDAARRWFFVDEAAAAMRAAGGELCLICAEGRAFLDAACLAQKRYDLIVLDAFAGARPVESLATPEAAAAYAQLVGARDPGAGGGSAARGMVAANVVTPGGDAAFLRDLQTALERSFAQVELVPCADDEWSGDDNYLLVCK